MTRIHVCGVRRDGAEGFALTIHEVAKAFKARMDERLRPLGLSNATRRVIGSLACSPRPLTQRELAGAIFVEGPTLVRLLDRLEALGWVTRETVPGDRRSKHVHLTEMAGPVIDQMREAAVGIEQEILRDIPVEDIRTAHKVLLLLREKLAEMAAGGSPPPEPCCQI